MNVAVTVWVLLLAAGVLFVLAGFGIGLPRTQLGWLAAAVVCVAVLVLRWPPH
jgi:hypothetical protein